MDESGMARLADGQACKAAALLYAERGWSAIPLCPPDHVGVGKGHAGRCKRGSWGKAPMIDGWQSQTAGTATDIERWWKQWPNANVGLAMGVGGLIGIDADGDSGKAALDAIIAQGLVRTLEFVTPGGGHRQLYVASEEAMLTPQFEALAAKEEIRILGRGSQTVAPPSRHQFGGIYQWKSAF
jgi:hypothetical protein